MTRQKTFAILTASALCLPSLAFAGVSLGEKVGLTDTEITAALTAKGYVIEEIEHEDGEIEISATLEGSDVEIEVSPETGVIVSMKADSDDDDDDDVK